MPISPSELRFYRSSTVSDGAANGGRMSGVEAISGALANVFPAVGSDERTAGSTKYRKLFAKVANDDDIALQYAMIFIDKNTPGDDRIYFTPGTQVDTQGDLTGSEKRYSAGTLADNVSPGAASISVLWELPDTIPEDGDLLRITDRADVASPGNEEFVRIAGGPTGSSGEYTITLATALQNGYSAADTRVAQVLEPLDPNEPGSAELQNQVKPIVTDLDVTSTAGTVDPQYLHADSVGSIEQLFTLTWTGATAFDIAGDTVGAVGSGNVSGGAAPNNAALGKPYFNLEAAALGGTWQSGDVIVFATHPAAVPLWLVRVVPAGSEVAGANQAVLAIKGETS
jgi:hypothetical protein